MCIASIESTQDTLSAQIIVVDNGSDDGSAEAIRREFPWVELIASQTNLGFARANNLGLNLATGRYVFFLNPDTVLEEGALNRMIGFMERHDEFDVVGPKLVSPDGRGQWVCARRLPSARLLLFQALYLHRLPLVGERLWNRMCAYYDLNESQEVEAISGAAILARRTTIEDLGGFDEMFLHTGEDVDLCRRLRDRGSKIFYLAEATVVHFGGQSSSQVWARSGTMAILSTEMYLVRFHGRLHALMYRLVVQLVQMPIMVMVGLGKAFLRRDGRHDLRQRLDLAKSIWHWRKSELR